jgi:hypothetical protein
LKQDRFTNVNFFDTEFALIKIMKYHDSSEVIISRYPCKKNSLLFLIAGFFPSRGSSGKRSASGQQRPLHFISLSLLWQIAHSLTSSDPSSQRTILIPEFQHTGQRI